MASIAPWKEQKWLPGVLNYQQLESLKKCGLITNAFSKIDSDASAIDLHLTNRGFEMRRGSIKPFNKNYSQIITDSSYAKPLKIGKDSIFHLKKGHCYVFEVREKLHVSIVKDSPFYGQATAKSSVGRVDVIARLIVDGMDEYETFIPSKIRTGEMYLEITPITFDVKVKENISISQLRFCNGHFDSSTIRDEKFIRSVLNLDSDSQNTGTLSVDLSNFNISQLSHEMAAAYCAKGGAKIPIELWADKKYAKKKFWEPIVSTEQQNIKNIVIKKNNFYILRSMERISLPQGICIYARAMDETLGEMRIHYAGFVHPLFGTGRTDEKIGTPLIFEVRGHNVNVLLTHGEILARLIFYRMSQVAKKREQKKGNRKKSIKSGDYNEQELKLSKFFK